MFLVRLDCEKGAYEISQKYLAKNQKQKAIRVEISLLGKKNLFLAIEQGSKGGKEEMEAGPKALEWKTRKAHNCLLRSISGFSSPLEILVFFGLSIAKKQKLALSWIGSETILIGFYRN